ncbi:efflux RND transporter periplasmic adaptor subunit [Sphingomonas japonica]|uniref:Membrane fusion protein (Multidrug efflux system) n=1 Tax=Sphingomonas japonica TaxID=511662 RepID=A0ABX0U3Q1_9SPHN|nr:efflux RND transporter periplasmic adaptor subunit [Sphingomonas japonica]NIJ24670.1 membrane fusion protein (multidrug efflux system) [Sphingomonas japonica]
MQSRSSAQYGAFFSGAMALCLAVAACGGSEEGGDAAKAKGPPTVGYVTARVTSVPLTIQLAGRTSAYAMSEVRPQVSGVIQRRLFTEGSFVRAGQTLYQIDPSIYQAAVNEAQATLASARANAEATRVRAERLRPLAEIEAVAKQDYTDAAASARQATAAVQQAQAQLQTAQINLRFTRVPAPISGRINRSLFTVGALVTANQTEPLTTIQQLDPIFVDIQQSSAELLALRRSLAQEGTTAAEATVRLALEDGSDYGLTGVVQFSEAMVDPGTGTVTLRARFPNPQGLLLPGMFVRASFAQAIDTQAFLVPQSGVTRDARGRASALVVGPDNKVVQKAVTTDRTQGRYWVVTKGLAAGDRIIVQGTANAQPGTVVRPVEANTPQRIGPPPKAESGNADAPQNAN